MSIFDDFEEMKRLEAEEKRVFDPLDAVVSRSGEAGSKGGLQNVGRVKIDAQEFGDFIRSEYDDGNLLCNPTGMFTISFLINFEQWINNNCIVG